MAFFDWKEEYSTGIASIDEQHKRFIALINEIHVCILDEREEPIVSKVLDDLKQYAVYHFSQEEILFQEYGYKETKEHGEKHELYIKQIELLKTLTLSQKKTLSIQTLSILISWLEHHILEEDMAYITFMRGNGISMNEQSIL